MSCGATLADCDIHIRDEGTGCCDACFERDTHGLLEGAAPADLAQSIDNLHRLAAQMVLARHEHAKAITRLRADVSSLIEEVALLRGRVDESERRQATVDDRTKQAIIVAAMHEFRQYVRNLPERVQEVEDCVVGIEQHLKIRRKPPTERAV